MLEPKHQQHGRSGTWRHRNEHEEVNLQWLPSSTYKSRVLIFNRSKHRQQWRNVWDYQLIIYAGCSNAVCEGTQKAYFADIWGCKYAYHFEDSFRKCKNSTAKKWGMKTATLRTLALCYDTRSNTKNIKRAKNRLKTRIWFLFFSVFLSSVLFHDR